MERFVLEGRKLNGPPAAREVNATLKQRGLEHQYVRRCYLFIVRHITPCSVATYYYYAPVLQLGALSDDVIRLTAFLMPPGLKTAFWTIVTTNITNRKQCACSSNNFSCIHWVALPYLNQNLL